MSDLFKIRFLPIDLAEMYRQLEQNPYATYRVEFSTNLSTFHFTLVEVGSSEKVISNLSVNEIIETLIEKMISSGRSGHRAHAIRDLGIATHCGLDAVNQWLLGESPADDAYPGLFYIANEVAYLGHPLDIPMIDRLRELAVEAAASRNT